MGENVKFDSLEANYDFQVVDTLQEVIQKLVEENNVRVMAGYTWDKT